MTVDKLREILSYYPADAEITIKDMFNNENILENFNIETKISAGVIKTIIIHL